MKNKKNIPDIRFKGFAEEWMPMTLCELSEPLEYGLNASATTYDGINKYIRITDIDDDTHMLNCNGLTSPNANLSSSTNYQLKIGDILFARTGASVGKSYHYKEIDGLVFYAGFLIRARIKSNINSEFVFQNTLTNRYNKFVKITSQRSGQPGINAQEYSSWKLTIPKSADEQKNVGIYFQNIDNLIVTSLEKLDKIKTIKKACLEKMFPRNGSNIPEIRFKGFLDEWEKKEMSMVAIFNPKSELPNVFEYVDLESVVGTEMISHREESKLTAPSRAQRLAKQGDLFYQTVRPYQRNNHLFDNNIDNYVFSTGYAQLRPHGHGYFLLSLVQGELFVKTVLDNCAGTSFPAISSTDLAKIKVSIPKYDEQKVIGVFFKNLDKLITKTEQQINKLKNIKKACLDKMFVNTED